MRCLAIQTLVRARPFAVRFLDADFLAARVLDAAFLAVDALGAVVPDVGVRDELSRQPLRLTELSLDSDARREHDCSPIRRTCIRSLLMRPRVVHQPGLSNQLIRRARGKRRGSRSCSMVRISELAHTVRHRDSSIDVF